MVEAGGSEHGREAGIGVVKLLIGLEEAGAEFFGRVFGLGLELEGKEPFAGFAGFLERWREEAGEFGGVFMVAGIGKFLGQKQEKLRLV